MTKETFLTIDFNELADNNAAEYASAVIRERAIPDARDGLKPVQRKLIYGMADMGLTPSKPFKKSARVLGDVMGKYHPHGDAGLYTGLVNMAASWNNNVALVDPQGNFGSIELGTEAAAASRYTEVRLSDLGLAITQGLNQNAVDMVPNFDGSETEPDVLPVAIPLGMLNGQTGIAWSRSTDIPPHNIKELLKGAIHLAKGKPATAAALAKIIPAPDSPTGCDIILDAKDWEEAVSKGEGKFVMRSKIEVEKSKQRADLVIKTVPFNTKTENLKIEIAKVLAATPALGAQTIVDETDEDDVSIRIVFKKSTTEEMLLKARDYLYKKTKLQKSASFSNEFIYKGHPRVIGLLEYLQIFNEFRLETLKRIWKFESDKLGARLEILEGRLKIKDILNEVVAFARNASSKKEIETWLQSKYDFTQRQSEDIASTRIYQLNNTEFTALQNEFDDKTTQKAELDERLSNQEKAQMELVKDLEQTLATFAKNDRKSPIFGTEAIADVKEISIEETIESKPLKLIVKDNLEIFTMGRQAFANQIDNYKEHDIVSTLDATTTDFAMMITKDGLFATRLLNDLVKKTNIADAGVRLNTEIADLKAGSDFVGATFSDKAKTDTDDRLFVLTKFGKAKVILPGKMLPNVNTKIYLKKLRPMMKLETGDEIIFAKNLKKSDLATSVFNVQIADPSLKKGWRLKKVDLAKIADRTDGAGGSGFRLINLKGGQSMKKDTIEFVQKEADESN